MLNIKFLKLTVVLVGLFIFSSMMSCSETTDEVSEVQPENTESVSVEEDDFTESNVDLLKVDYKQFYDQLSPHGEWIEVTGDEIGVELDKSTASGEKVHRKMSFSQLFGVKSAYADDMDLDAFFVWKPAPTLSVGLTTDDNSPVAASYVPYTNGQWVNTDAGWYFQAPTPYEETVHHYGRWAYSPSVGWVWVPGRVWSPAWVDWREDDEYVAWSPLAPGVYLTDNRIIEPPIYEDRYIIVEKRYFVEPEIYKYHYIKNKKKVIIHEMRRVDGVMVVDHRVINRGPEVSVIETVLGHPIPVMHIDKVQTYSAVGKKGDVIYSYSPGFTEFKVVKDINKPVRKPVKFVSFNKKEKNPKKQEKNESSKESFDTKGNNKNKSGEREFKHSGRDDMLDKRKIQEERKKGNDNNVKNQKRSKGNDNNIKNESKSKGKNKSNGMRNESKKNDGKVNNGSKNKGNMDKGNDNRQKSKGDNGSKQKGKGKK